MSDINQIKCRSQIWSFYYTKVYKIILIQDKMSEKKIFFKEII
jgi:hypothetical protein